MSNSKKYNPAEDNFLLNGSEIIGNLKTNSNIRIDGRLEGDINSTEKIFLGKFGNVTGDVSCENAYIEGQLEGDLTVNGVADIRNGAKIKGDIVASKLIFEDGSELKGSIKLKSN